METEKAPTSSKSAPSKRSIPELTEYIQGLRGKERQDFCRTLTQDEKKAYIKCLKDKEKTKVKGIYRCLVPLGGSVKFSCRFHDGDIETYEMKDGEEYEVPLSVANHLRNNCWFPEHAFTVDAAGKPSTTIGRKHNTHNFEPSGFF